MSATVTARPQTSSSPPAPSPPPEAAWRRRGRRRVAITLLVVAVLAVVSAFPFRDENRRYTGQPLVLVAGGPSAERWLAELRRGGLLAEVGAVDLTRRDVLVVPADAPIDAPTVERVVSWVRDGGFLISSHTELLAATGLVVDEPRTVDAVRTLHVEAPRPWPADVAVRPIAVAGGERPLQPLVYTADATVAARLELGTGRVLALGWDPFTANAPLSHTAPRLVDWIIESVAGAPLVERDDVHLYFVPALARLRYGDGRMLDALVDQLAIASVVYVDGSDAEQLADYKVDPAALVTALHDRGVQAHLWFAVERIEEGWEELLPAAEWDGIHVTGVDAAGDAAAQAVADAVVAAAATSGLPVTLAGAVDDLGTPLDLFAALAPDTVVSIGGAALAEAVASADTDDGLRVFALGVLEPADLVSLPRMLTASATVDGTALESSHPLVVRAPGERWRQLYVNGEPYPNAGGRAVLPVGRNDVEWRQGYYEGPGIVRTSVRLRSASGSKGRLSLTYDTAIPGLLVVDKRPTELVVDGERHDLVVREHNGTFVVRLPAGDTVSATLRFR